MGGGLDKEVAEITLSIKTDSVSTGVKMGYGDIVKMAWTTVSTTDEDLSSLNNHFSFLIFI